MSKDKDAAVDELSVGMLASLMHVQGCRNYTAVDSSRASRDLRDIRDSKVSSEARQQIRDDLQSFWSELRELRRRPRHSGSPENHRKGRRRAGRRRRQRSPGKEGAAHGRAASSGSESAGSGRHGRQRYSSSGSDASPRSRSRKKKNFQVHATTSHQFDKSTVKYSGNAVASSQKGHVFWIVMN